MRRVPANSSSPVTFVPLTKKPDTWSDLSRNFIGAPYEALASELRPEQALVQPIHFLEGKEVYFDLSLSAIFLDGHLRSKRLFQGVNRCLDVWIDNSGTASAIIV